MLWLSAQVRMARAKVRGIQNRLAAQLKAYPGEVSERGGRMCVAAPAGGRPFCFHGSQANHMSTQPHFCSLQLKRFPLVWTIPAFVWTCPMHMACSKHSSLQLLHVSS